MHGAPLTAGPPTETVLLILLIIMAGIALGCVRRFNEPPSVFSVYGYTMIELFTRALQKTGQALATDAYIKAMETLNDIPVDIFGNPKMSFSATNHLASNAARMSQSRTVGGRWFTTTRR